VEWNTGITALLGSKYPIIEGAYGGFGTSALAVAVSEAGGFGIITAGALRTPERLRDDIRRVKSMTDKPFGVNLSLAIMSYPDEMREVAIEEGVPVVETAGPRPDEHGRRLKEAGVKWIHKVGAVRHALAAERRGADAVMIVGLDGVGFKGPLQLPGLVAIPWAAKQIKIPIIASGGIGDARGFLAALALGAEGVSLGTAFMATKECPISDRYKQALVDGDPTAPRFRDRALATPKPEEFAELMKERDSMPQDEWLRRFAAVTSGGATDEVDELAEELGEEALGFGMASLAVASVDRVVTVKELIDGIIQGAEEILSAEPFASLWRYSSSR
jgi:NAD(P)H-dependent flavin oxidoreductase YrpB (nitropropane dioxygenase family)